MWASVLIVSYYLLGLALGGLFFVATQYVSSAGWSIVLRRVPEAMVGLLTCGVIGVALVLVLHP